MPRGQVSVRILPMSYREMLEPASADPAKLEKNRRILVVDDNEAIHDDFRKILLRDSLETEFDADEAAFFGTAPARRQAVEFEMSFASQGRRALELVQAAWQTQHRYSMVFMDVRMPPGWDGLETTIKLWDVDPDLQVVICTAFSDKSWEAMMEKVTYPDRLLILKKPFDSIEVLQLAYALTEKWSLLQASKMNLEMLEQTVRQRTSELSAANLRLEAEMAARQASTEQVREQAMLLERARDAILVRDLEDKIVFWNHGAETLYGWNREEVTGRKALELLYDDAAAGEVEAARQKLLAQGSWMGELSQITRAGAEVMVECRWTLVRDDEGRPRSILEINSDITEKSQLEARYLRAQRLESIGTLAGGMAHNLNNILQPITLAMDLFRLQIADEESRATLDLVSANAQRAMALIKQVLSFARGVEGARVAVSPGALIKEVAGILSETFPKNIDFRQTSPGGAWSLLGDATQLEQVLLNLCVNARDAMPDGGVLTLSADETQVDEHDAASQPDASPGRYVVFTVTDTGIGIPRDLQEKVFDPFFTTKDAGSATGLGLSTTLSIVRSHGGFITLASQEHHGSSFKVFLPATEAPARPPVSPAEPNGDLRGNGERILIVDDEAAILTLLRLTLEAFGYRVFAGRDGAEGVSLYVQHLHEIKVVITDIVMPVMDGPAMIAALKKLDPAVKVIATTGMSSQVSLETMARLGVDRILAKPCSAPVILGALKEVLAGPPVPSGH